MGEITLGGVAGLIAAIAFVLLVGAIAWPLIRAARTIDQATQSLKEVTEHVLPIVDEAAKSVSLANTSLERVDTITNAAAETTQNVSAMTSLISATVGAPLIKVAAFSMAVRGLFTKKPRS